jgi:hypothetical protein
MTLVSASLVYANGRVLELKKHTAGPYEIAAGTIPGTPVVGAFHMTMNVTDTANNAPIIDANVIVSAVGPVDPEDPESGPTILGPLEAKNSPTDPIFYDINTVVGKEGTWMFTVDVNAGLGEASTEFPIEVTTANPITGIVTLITLLTFVTILGLSVRAYLRERGRREQSVNKA